MDNRGSAGARKSFFFDLTNARDGKELTVRGRFIRVAGASDTVAEIQIAVQENRAESYETLKKNGTITEGNGFDKIFIKNTAQAGKSVRVIVSEGSDDYDVENLSLGAIDSIGSIDTAVEIINASGDILDVTDADVKFNTGAMRGAQNEVSGSSYRWVNYSPKTPLLNASFASVNNATSTVVTAVANTAGVVVRSAQISGFGNSTSAYVRAGSNDILQLFYNGGAHQHAEIRDIIIPAGVALTINSSATSMDTDIWYEVI